MKRDITKIDDDISVMKRMIRQKLTSDPDIIEALNNPMLDTSCPDDYLNNNIFAFIRIPGAQDTAKNFICFSVDDIEASRSNDVMKVQYVEFVVFCHADDIKTQWDIERHDLLGYLIRDIFNWSHTFGLRARLIYNQEGVTDNYYSTRTLKFELTKPNSLQRGVAWNQYDPI